MIKASQLQLSSLSLTVSVYTDEVILIRPPES